MMIVDLVVERFEPLLNPLQTLLNPLQTLLNPLQTLLHPLQTLLNPVQTLLHSPQPVLHSPQPVLYSIQPLVDADQFAPHTYDIALQTKMPRPQVPHVRLQVFHLLPKEAEIDVVVSHA